MMTTHTTNISTFFFFFNDTATTEIYTLSLHDALPILLAAVRAVRGAGPGSPVSHRHQRHRRRPAGRSEEHTSELQSQSNLVCRLLLEKKNNIRRKIRHTAQSDTRIIWTIASRL